MAPVAHADYVYVSNTGAGTITRIDTTDASESIFASGLDEPEGLAFDSAGNLYVADSGDGIISEINSAGSVSTFASGLNSPAGLTFDPSGNLYVANTGNNTISKVNSSGSVSVFATGMQSFPYNGAFLAADSAGNIYANASWSLETFDPNGNLIAVSYPYENVGAFAIDGAGHIYIYLENRGGISGNGGLQTDVSDFPAPYNNEYLYFLEGTFSDLAFDGNGNLYATGRLPYLDSNGNIVLNMVLIEFGVNGDNSIVTADITGGGYFAVQSVPEPGMCTISVLASVLCFRGWVKWRQS